MPSRRGATVPIRRKLHRPRSTDCSIHSNGACGTARIIASPPRSHLPRIDGQANPQPSPQQEISMSTKTTLAAIAALVTLTPSPPFPAHQTLVTDLQDTRPYYALAYTP